MTVKSRKLILELYLFVTKRFIIIFSIVVNHLQNYHSAKKLQMKIVIEEP